jgi:hypothetical protein
MLVRGIAVAFLFLVAALPGAVAPAHAQCTQMAPCVTSPVNLGGFGGSFSFAYGVNVDGTVVVGSVPQRATPSSVPFVGRARLVWLIWEILAAIPRAPMP